jgi:hypothetical protein
MDIHSAGSTPIFRSKAVFMLTVAGLAERQHCVRRGRVVPHGATLNVKAGWPVARISPRIEFQIVLNGTFRIEPDDNFLVHG